MATSSSQALGEVIRSLDCHDPLAPQALSSIVEQIRVLLRARSARVYCPQPTEAGWDLEFDVWAGADAGRRAALHRRFVRSTPANDTSFAAYDPRSVQPEQRNRALSVEHLTILDPASDWPNAGVESALDQSHEDQIRALICDGPRLLAWCGAVREEPFSHRELELLQSLVEPLRRRFEWMRQARSTEQRPLIEAILGAFPEPALILSRGGRVEYTNRAGLHMLEWIHSRRLFEARRPALVQGGSDSDFVALRLDVRGASSYTLVRYVGGDERCQFSLRQAACRWHLNLKQGSALEGVMKGRTNKEIALDLHCAEVTVERYMTTIFRRSGAHSRTELLSLLYTI
jgi:DNA-binding CsgD family transcriptional regulator